jgi:hypothetical protein
MCGMSSNLSQARVADSQAAMTCERRWLVVVWLSPKIPLEAFFREDPNPHRQRPLLTQSAGLAYTPRTVDIVCPSSRPPTANFTP